MVGDPGYGDDNSPNGGVFADFDTWINNGLLPKLGKIEDREVSETRSVRETELSTPYQVARKGTMGGSPADLQNERLSEPYKLFFESISPLSPYVYHSGERVRATSRTRPIVGRLLENKRISATNWEQDTRHLSIIAVSESFQKTTRLEEQSIDARYYHAGDVASVVPINSTDDVNRFLSVLPDCIAAIADTEMAVMYNSIARSSSGVDYAFWPSRCTLRGWLTFCADIQALPEREDLRALSKFCSPSHAHGKEQREKLCSLSETAESALYVDYILREKRSWADVLYDFDSLRAPESLLKLEHLFSLLSPIRPRDFSIASSPSELWLDKRDPALRLELCVAIVKGTTPLGRTFHGLCSSYWERVKASDEVQFWIRPGSFQKLPLEVTAHNRMARPVLCIGSGTGVAPLRGIIRERVTASRTYTGEDSAAARANVDVDNVLVFGCRKQSCDFYYEAEWKGICRHKLRVFPAFSRDQQYKIYVQQVIKKAESETKIFSRHLLEHGGALYIAGNPKMARAVQDEIVEILTPLIEGGKDKAKLFLSKLQRQGKFSVEAWS